MFDRPHGRGIHFDDFANLGLRDGEGLRTDGGNDGVGNRQRDRQLDDEPRAFTGGGIDRQGPAELAERSVVVGELTWVQVDDRWPYPPSVMAP